MVLAYDGSSAIVAYVPAEQAAIQIKFLAGGTPQVGTYRTVPGFSSALTKFSQSGWSYQWLSPRSGATAPSSFVPSLVSPGVFSFRKPLSCNFESLCDANDWVLRLIKINGSPLSSAALSIDVSNEVGPVTGDSSIVVHLLDDSGALQTEFEIGGQGSSLLGPPKIAYEPGGNSLVVWQSDSDEGTTVMGRVLDSQGNPVTEELAVNSDLSAAPGHPEVSTLEGGNFIVTWTSWDEAGDGPWVWYRLIDRSGSPLGLEQMAVNCELIAGDYPHVTPIQGGGFGIAWEMNGGAGIYFIQFDSGGDLIGDGHLAQGSNGWPVLEAIDSTASISWGVYSFDATGTPTTDGDTVQAYVQPTFCR